MPTNKSIIIRIMPETKIPINWYLLYVKKSLLAIFLIVYVKTRQRKNVYL